MSTGTFRTPTDLDASKRESGVEDPTQQSEICISPKERRWWQVRKKDKDINWEKEYNKLSAHSERLDDQLIDMQKTMREKAATLNRMGQSAFNDAIRNYDKPLDMVRALLQEFDAALERGSKSDNSYRVERRRVEEMTEQLVLKDRDWEHKWRLHMTEVERKQVMDSQHEAMQNRKIQELTANLHNCNVFKEKAENERAALQLQVNGHGSDIEQREIVHRERLSKAEQDLRNEQRTHACEIKEIEEDNEDKLIMKQKDHDSQVRVLRKTLSDQQKTQKSRIDLMNTEFDEEFQQLKQKQSEEIDQLHQKISAKEQAHRVELEACEKRHTQEALRLKREFKQILSQKQIAQAATEKALREEIAQYSGALLTRDKNDFNMMDQYVFEPMTDSDIEAKFADLVQDVDTLSRLDWKPDPKGWTTQDLRSLAENERILKKQILQDSIWSVLHKFVFCSPFRVFGEKGESLESDWNKECGADNELDNGDYVWPKPQMETERWRYITIRECKAALRQKLPSQFDPRWKLKKDFQESIEGLRKSIVAALEDLVVLEKGSLQILDKMAMRAARTWLDFELQRCRVVVLVQGSNLSDVEAKVQRTREDGLDLVMVPRLMRFGNSKGEGLDTGEIIAGRGGEVVRIGRERKNGVRGP